VGIAQAMLGNPDIIILDEPTVGLDPKQIIEIRTLIRRLGEMKTVIISSHILAEISEICDHVLIIAEGKLIANAPIDELKNKGQAGARIHLSIRGDETGILDTLSAIPEIDSCTVGVSREVGVVKLTVTTKSEADLRDRIFFAMADRRYAVISMEKEEASLESVFLSLTEKAKKRPANAQKAKGRGKKDSDGIYELIDENGPVLSKGLKALGNYRKGGNKGFDTSITRLQAQGYVIISDFAYMIDKNGNEYGWGVAEYATPEQFLGESFTEEVYARTPEDSYERLLDHMRKILPYADEKDIRKLLKR